jgi:hypothetical protein
MKQDIEEDILIKNYLLGNLPPEEQLQIEERLFLDRDYFQTLQVVEDDLIDDYLYEELSPDERERFEHYYLSTPERHEALRVATALKSYISTNSAAVAPPVSGVVQQHLPPPSKLSFLSSLRLGNAPWQLTLAVALLLVIVGGLALYLWGMRTPDRASPPQEARQSPQPGLNQSSPQQNEEQMARNLNSNREPQNQQEQYAGQQNRDVSNRAPGQQEKESLSQGKPDNRVNSPDSQSQQRATRAYAFLITPSGLTRGDGSPNEVNVPADAGVINLQLPLVEDAGYRNLRVILYRDDNKVVRRWNGLSSTDSKAGRVVSVGVPAQLLQQRNYTIKLLRVLPDGNVREVQAYHFRVAKK